MKDKVTGNKVFLSNHVGALPNSKTIKENEIRFVVSLLNFWEGSKQEGEEEELSELRRLYYGEGGERKRVVESVGGVIYHLVDIADYYDPSLVEKRHPELFEEACCFIDAGLRKGNVLVHCNRGERRSPTVLIAWMGTRGIGVMESIGMIDREYCGEDEGWGRNFKKTRALWMKKLKQWKKEWRVREKKWVEKMNCIHGSKDKKVAESLSIGENKGSVEGQGVTIK